MRLSDMRKDTECGACSGNKICYECRIERRQNKRRNNKKIRQINKHVIAFYEMED